MAANVRVVQKAQNYFQIVQQRKSTTQTENQPNITKHLCKTTIFMNNLHQTPSWISPPFWKKQKQHSIVNRLAKYVALAKTISVLLEEWKNVLSVIFWKFVQNGTTKIHHFDERCHFEQFQKKIYDLFVFEGLTKRWKTLWKNGFLQFSDAHKIDKDNLLLIILPTSSNIVVVNI
jgi:hypothetical protein